MDNLPPKIVLQILSFLPTKDLISFYLAFEEFRKLCIFVDIKELVVSEVVGDFKLFWADNYKIINLNTAISFKAFRILNSRFQIGDKLKRLHFFYLKETYFHFSFFNNLIALEHLEVSSPTYDSVYCVQALNLPNLRTLKAFYSKDELTYASCAERLILNTPKLRKLICFNLHLVRLFHSQTVRHLETLNYDEKIREFINLEYLRFDCLTSFAMNILLYFSELKQLHIILNPNSFDGKFWETPMNVAIDYLLKQRIVNKSSVKICLQGVELIARELRTAQISPSSTHFQMVNYNLLIDKLPFVSEIDYNEILFYADGLIPDDFYSKFNLIQRVKVNAKIQSQAYFLSFLKKLNFLHELELFYSKLEQDFYDQLPNDISLTKLTIHEAPEILIDYSFILKFNKLISFETIQELKNSYHIAIESFKNLKYLTVFNFRCGEEIVLVNKNWEKDENYNLVCLKYDNSEEICLLEKEIDLNQLLHYFYTAKTIFSVQNQEFIWSEFASINLND